MRKVFSSTAQVRWQAWSRAAKHQGGKGIELGTPHLCSASKVYKMLLRNGAHQQASALKAVVCGGQVTSARFNSKALCDFCGQTDSLWHAYWQCPALSQWDNPDDDPHGADDGPHEALAMIPPSSPMMVRTGLR